MGYRLWGRTESDTIQHTPLFTYIHPHICQVLNLIQATSAATCRLASGSRCQASRWRQGANSRMRAEQLFSESWWPGATQLLCSPVDKVLHLEEALSRLWGH